MRCNGGNFILVVQRRKILIGLRMIYIVGRESIDKGKERYDVTDIVYIQLQVFFPQVGVDLEKKNAAYRMVWKKKRWEGLKWWKRKQPTPI